jgi:hypothetical protein
MNVRVKPRAAPVERDVPFECVALVLQGGGALGAYQAGVYEALAEAGIYPDWVAGISIGAVNCAILAGNPPETRIEIGEDKILLLLVQKAAFWAGNPEDFPKTPRRFLAPRSSRGYPHSICQLTVPDRDQHRSTTAHQPHT